MDAALDTASKRRWRRAAVRRLRNREPISARLVLDQNLRGDVGVLSDDLIKDLFPHVNLDGDDDIYYIAISPWSPIKPAIDDVSWTMLPVRLQQLVDNGKSTTMPRSTVQFPASAGSVQSFVRALEALELSHGISLSTQRPIEVLVLDAVPLHLDTIYVMVERHLLRRVDEVQSKFRGGFNADGTGNSRGTANRDIKQTSKQKNERLMAAVRGALSKQRILHTGDILPLPLPSHPITHVLAPPAKISYCEPVAQGLLISKTKIVLIQARSRQNKLRVSNAIPSPVPRLLQQSVADEADDTSNEQFYSATEDILIESATDMESTSLPEDTESEASTHSLSDASDDSLDDMISLAAPQLPPAASGTLSAATCATPRPGGMKRFDVHTPGSVLSSFTSVTARGGGRSKLTKTFKVECLLSRIPNEVLHPRPREDDDSDAFVFVDVHALAKIGCFSGDWVRIEASEGPQSNMLSSMKLNSGLGSLVGDNNEDSGSWRAAKVYGITGIPALKPRYSIHQTGYRRSSISHTVPHRFTPTVLVPPILLSNLQNTKYLLLSPMHQANSRPGLARPKSSTSSKFPPIAKEVTLLKISTPLSTDRTLQPILFAGLKGYFEPNRRVVKSGDLVGISVDEGLGRALYSPNKPPAESGTQEDELTAQLGICPDTPLSGGYRHASRKVGVAWFRVSQVAPAVSEESGDATVADYERWGGVAIIDSLTTRMAQAGSEISTVPSTIGNWWEYWLGAKVLPRPRVEPQTLSGLLAEQPPRVFVPLLQRRLRELISVATSPRAIQLRMKPIVILLTSTQRHIGKSTVARRACADVGIHSFDIDAYDILAEGGANGGGDMKTEAFLKARVERAFSCGPQCTALLIRHIDVLNADRMVTALKEVVSEARVIIATSTDVDKVPEGIRGLFTHELEMSAPDEKEREGILRNAVADQGVKISPDVDLGSVAIKTAALVAGDLVDVVERAVAAKTLRLEKLAASATTTPQLRGDSAGVSIRDVQLAGGFAARCVTKTDFDAAVDAARKNFADAIGAPNIPNVTWDDVGGLTNVKETVMETIQLPLQRPELFAKGMKKRSGILFYGPPGTGKTLLAKAIATEFSLNFFSVKGPELLNMYIGESEANVRRVFQRARDARPCVVFFDELDSVAPKRGNQGDSGGVMDRIVSQLLAELDGMSGGDDAASGSGVFVIGATNRPDLLDGALLRPGRFDKMLYLGVSDTHDKQCTILEALTRKFTLHPDVSLKRIADRLPFTYTGADLYALCSDAMLKAITRQATAVDEKIKVLPGGPVTTAYFFDHLATPDDVAVMVTEEDFIAAQNELVASVSAKELEHFERVRCTFESVEKDKAKKSASKNHETSSQLNGSLIASNPNGTINGSSTIGEAIANGYLIEGGGMHTSNPPDADGLDNTENFNFASALRPKVTQASIRPGGGRGKTGTAVIDGSRRKGKAKGKGVASYADDESDFSLADADVDVGGEQLRCKKPVSQNGIRVNDDHEDEYIVRTDHLVKT